MSTLLPEKKETIHPISVWRCETEQANIFYKLFEGQKMAVIAN